MHELQFMTNLVRMVEDVCEQQSGLTPSTIKLQVASYSHLAGHTQEELQTMFQFVARNTRAQQAILEITTKTVLGQCQECGTKVVFRSETFLCPSCNSIVIKTEPSPEVTIQEITYHEHLP